MRRAHFKTSWIVAALLAPQLLVIFVFGHGKHGPGTAHATAFAMPHAAAFAVAIAMAHAQARAQARSPTAVAEQSRKDMIDEGSPVRQPAR